MGMNTEHFSKALLVKVYITVSLLQINRMSHARS